MIELNGESFTYSDEFLVIPPVDSLQSCGGGRGRAGRPGEASAGGHRGR